MVARFEELDWQQTPMGELVLRRRTEPGTDTQIYEVKLGEEFLMSSLFTVAEEQMSTLGLAAATGETLDVLVGAQTVADPAEHAARARRSTLMSKLWVGFVSLLVLFFASFAVYVAVAFIRAPQLLAKGIGVGVIFVLLALMPVARLEVSEIATAAGIVIGALCGLVLARLAPRD